MQNMNICITGGTSGIGKEIALQALNQGASIIVIGRTDKHAEEFMKSIDSEARDKVKVIVTDLSQPENADSAIHEILAHFPELDVLVNSAGTISSGGIEVEDFATWHRVMSVNLDSVFLMTKGLLPALKQGKTPSVINISSVCGLRPCSSLSYSVSKAGLDMFTKVLAKDLGQYGIRVNAVNPGVVESNLQYSAGLFSDENKYSEWKTNMAAMHPLGRIGEPTDVANMVLFLTSQQASWISGAIISVDGARSTV